MRKKPIILGLAASFGAIMLLDAAVSIWTSEARASDPVDLSSVNRIEVRGAASRVTINTDNTEPLEARLMGTRSGWGALWRSSWFDDGCAMTGSMSLDRGSLIVDTGDAPFDFDWDDCRLELRANLRPDAAVLIDQRASAITLAGDFSVLDIKSDAGDVDVEGHADAITLSGAALRARIAFDEVRKSETIRLMGKMMDATLIFPTGSVISYAVESIASYIDSALPNTPGAKPEIRIRGDMVRTTIKEG
ncbi:hypothetical protein M2360_000267 [Rhizobium sp. SG_E_25_P2]|uniref:hypothetical protein n=1 Tax=Rhizobium sp. SG_E_25_P2 TaxID=2879942 RepID=UPI002473E3E6|nr:hypothetical protein [Rhizobium sp. SG_E_25_P2]MDH6264886.1 hypothetical protein [Rhizobium sp. SG_E_25_P2]